MTKENLLILFDVILVLMLASQFTHMQTLEEQIDDLWVFQGEHVGLTLKISDVVKELAE